MNACRTLRLAAAGLAGLAGCAEQDGTASMVARLEQVAQQADPEKDVYLNAERVELFRRRLEQADANGEPKPPIRFMLASELVLSGHPEEAAHELIEMREKVAGRGAQFDPKFEVEIQKLLAQAWLRAGEQENCILHHGTESCLMPIRGTGVHTAQSGSRQAIEAFEELLRINPEDWASRWLLNIAYMTVGEHPDQVPPQWLIPADVFESEADIGRFPDVAMQAGLALTGLAGGACMEDFDGDGRLDILTSDWSLRGPMHFMRNHGDGTFSERTQQAGLNGLVGGLNMVHADYDNDGDADVLVLRGAWKADTGARYPISLLANRGDGTFEDVTEAAGMLCFLSTQTAAWGDYDNDGWLDVFIGNESVAPHLSPCRLYHNEGDGTFREVAAERGVDFIGYVKGVGWGDLDNDGRLDLYLSRMDGDNLLFHNQGERFVDVARQAGVTDPFQSFPTWWFDYDNDGWLDIFVSGYRFGQTDDVAKDYMGLENKGVQPRLYRNRHDGTFEDVTAAMRLDRVLPTMGCNYGDLDNDGWLDFYLATGEPDFRALYPNRMFRNDQGKSFQDVTTSGGFGHLQKGHAVTFGDVDEDGDQDVFVVIGGAFAGDVFQRALFENPGQAGHWVTLRLEGRQANRCAIGARVRVSVERPDGSQRDIHLIVGTGGSFGSASLQQEIGLGDAVEIRELEIRWPGSGVQVLDDLEMDRVWKIREGEAPSATLH